MTNTYSEIQGRLFLYDPDGSLSYIVTNNISCYKVVDGEDFTAYISGLRRRPSKSEDAVWIITT